LGPNLSLSGIGMVFGAGFNFKAGDLNLPINIAFVPGIKRTIDRHIEGPGPDGDWNTWQDNTSTDDEITTTTGSRISITLGFNLGR